jgi:septin family protein
MMMGGGGGLIEERDGMTEQEMIAMHEAIMAQMQQDNEDIYIDEEEDAG